MGHGWQVNWVLVKIFVSNYHKLSLLSGKIFCKLAQTIFELRKTDFTVSTQATARRNLLKSNGLWPRLKLWNQSFLNNSKMIWAILLKFLPFNKHRFVIIWCKNFENCSIDLPATAHFGQNCELDILKRKKLERFLTITSYPIEGIWDIWKFWNESTVQINLMIHGP